MVRLMTSVFVCFMPIHLKCVSLCFSCSHGRSWPCSTVLQLVAVCVSFQVPWISIQVKILSERTEMNLKFKTKKMVPLCYLILYSSEKRFLSCALVPINWLLVLVSKGVLDTLSSNSSSKLEKLVVTKPVKKLVVMVMVVVVLVVNVMVKMVIAVVVVMVKVVVVMLLVVMVVVLVALELVLVVMVMVLVVVLAMTLVTLVLMVVALVLVVMVLAMVLVVAFVLVVDW